MWSNLGDIKTRLCKVPENQQLTKSFSCLGWESKNLTGLKDAKEDESVEKKNNPQKEFFDTFEHFVYFASN